MSNSLNAFPIRVDTTFTSWRNNQTLNTGKSQPTIQNPNPSLRQWGIRPTLVIWTDPGDNASFQITDPNDGTILLQDDTATGFIGPNPKYDFIGQTATWRDFNVTITGGALLIFFRA